MLSVPVTDSLATRGCIPSPRLSRIGVVRHIEDFSDTVFTGHPHWNSNAASPTLESDTDYYMATDGTTVAGTLFTCTVGGGTDCSMFKYYGGVGGKDVSGCHLVIDVYIHEGTGISSYIHIENMYITLKDSNSVTATYKFAVGCGGAGNGGIIAGWNSFSIPLESGKGSVDLTDIDYFTLVIDRDSQDNTPAVTFGRLMFYEQPTTPGIVVFGFDGTYDTQKRAAMYLNANGMVGTFFTSKGTQEQEGKMTFADLYQLKSAGHLIASYPAHDGIYWVNKTLQQKKDALIVSQKYFGDLGFASGMRIVSTPGSGYNQDDRQLLLGGWLDCLTGHTNGTGFPLTFYDLQHLPFNAGPGVSTHEDVIDNAVEDRGIAMFIFHQCDGQGDSDITYNYFKGVVDTARNYIDAGTLVARTPLDIISGNWE